MADLLCLGDSLTKGYEVSNEDRWTNLLAQEVDAQIINAGINGDTTSGMLARCERLLIEHKPSRLLIIGGTNDLWFGLKDELIVSNLYAIAKQAMYHEVEPLVGIPTPCFNLNELNFNQENYSECIRSFRNLLIRYCEFKEIKHVDLAHGMNQEHMLTDGLHPNKSGHSLICSNLKEWLIMNPYDKLKAHF